MAAATFASIVLTYRVIAGSFMMPWSMATRWWGGGSFVSNLMLALSDRDLRYPFVWLLPLGVWHLKRFPSEWMIASIVTGLFAFGFAGYHQLVGTVNRPIFNIIAPLFSMSVASLLAAHPSWTHRPNRQKQSE